VKGTGPFRKWLERDRESFNLIVSYFLNFMTMVGLIIVLEHETI